MMAAVPTPPSKQRPQSAPTQRRPVMGGGGNRSAAKSPERGGGGAASTTPYMRWQPSPVTPSASAIEAGANTPHQPVGTPSSTAKRPSSAQCRWGEKRKTVPTSYDVMKGVATKIRDTEARTLRERNEQVRICDRPDSGKFNTVFHTKNNLDLQIESHRTLMNTRFTPDSERLQDQFEDHAVTPREGQHAVAAAQPSTSSIGGVMSQSQQQQPSAMSVGTRSRPTSARSRTSVLAETTTSAAAALPRAQSLTVGPPHSTPKDHTAEHERIPLKPSFRTVWRQPRCDDMRLDALHNYSLGIHKEPFVNAPERIQFRKTAVEAKRPYEDARRAAEAVSSSRPATPRSVMQFFGVEEEEEYQEVDKAHNMEWKTRVLHKIEEAKRKEQSSPRSSHHQATATGSSYQHAPSSTREILLKKKESTSLLARKEKGATSTQQIRREPMKASSSEAAPPKRNGKGLKTGAIDAAHPKDVYAWSAQIVHPSR